jgi:hypothetical protein
MVGFGTFFFQLPYVISTDGHMVGFGAFFFPASLRDLYGRAVVLN